MGAYAANELGVPLTQFKHFIILRAQQWIDLGEETHGCVVEQPGHNRGSLDQPDLRKSGPRECCAGVEVSHGMHSPWYTLIP